MRPPSEQPNDKNAVNPKPELELLLFVDRRSTAKEQIQQISSYLDAKQVHLTVNLNVIEVSEQPYLVEHYRLVATPALVKTAPAPRQVLAGSNLFDQLQECWPDWEFALSNPESVASLAATEQSTVPAPPSVQWMELSEEIFRLQQDKATLQDQLRFKDRLITILAHDLRNPLTAAALALETLEGQWDAENIIPLLPSETLHRITKHAHSQTQIIENMITNLLDAARSSETSVSIRPQALKLDELCNRIADEMQETFTAKSQTLGIDIPSDLPLVLVDADHIRQVIINLLDNAIKYTPTQGRFQISAFHRTTQKVQVSVCDNGLGIPLEKQAHIFQDNFRLSRDQNKDGYGLGLAFCQRIVRAHYGQMWVDSVLNKGSCFHFTLPVYPL